MKECETTVRVRYEDADPMGFLHHAKYFSYFEIGRTELFRQSGGNYRQMEESGLFVVVVKAECRFSKPARYDDVLTIHTKLAKLSMAKIEHEYIASRSDEILAKGNVTLAVVDRDGRVQPIPDWIQKLY
ncbi:MAG: thioesterase family protein [Planctomycetota bacterium]|jgi:acyl-CoA thioester hydrolase|nr:thioesterase family protein [Planctomycetota bacterium]